VIRVQGRAVVYGEVWFDEPPAGDASVDILVHRQRSAPVPDSRAVPFLTMRTDLALTEAAILAQCQDNCRYQIRRADAKDGLSHEFITDAQAGLDEFIAFFDAFARRKCIVPADRAWLAAACRARRIVLTAARRNGEALAWHAYLVAGDCARIEHTASSFREKDPAQRALIGRANRWLHWRNMLRFKATGIRWYDWGGLFEDESTPDRAGINRFKRSFGGQQVRRYDCTVPASLRGRIWLPVRDAWRRLRELRN
jgi:hypothetical protein